MKWLIYILLLVNLGVFVWHYQTSSTDVVTKLEQKFDAPKLVLLREILPDSRSKRRFPNKQDNDVVELPRCYRMGPFIGENSVTKALELLTAQGIVAKKSSHKDDNQAGFWVFIPPQSSRKKAKAITAQFKAMGEKHFFLVASGEFKNAISLGLFSLRKHADARLDGMRKLGFGPAMRNVNLPKALFWLDWERDPEQHISREVFINIRERFKDIGQVEVACADISGTTLETEILE